jgi:uncharacterized OsmC-like protein
MYNAIVESEDGRKYRGSSNGYGFAMGQDGAGPIDALLAGLCACVAHHVYRRAAERKIVFSGLRVEASADLAVDKLSLSHIALTLELKDGAPTGDDRADLVRQAVRCPLYNTLAKGLKIDVSVS